MTTNVQDFLKLGGLPEFLTQNTTLKSYKKIRKVFRSIGLVNCSEPANMDNFYIIKNTAYELAKVLTSQINNCGSYLNEYRTNWSQEYYSFNDVQRIEMAKLAKLCWDVYSSYRGIDHTTFVSVSSDNKVSLSMPHDVLFCGEIFARKGQSLFKIYNKLSEMIAPFTIPPKFLGLQSFENFDIFKRYSADNVPADTMKIVFSSDGPDGLWDIATMSMRGVRSCQSWDGDSHYRLCLLGSITDSNVGIIYLTSGSKNKYGTTMTRRSLVKLVLNNRTNKPVIIVDRMYPGCDNTTLDVFLNFIRKKTNGKFPVLYGPRMNYEEYSIPIDDSHFKFRYDNRSYRDTKFNYKFDNSARGIYKKAVFNKIVEFEKIIYSSLSRFDCILLRAGSIFSNEPDRKFKNMSFDDIFNHTNTIIANFAVPVANFYVDNGPKVEDFRYSSDYCRALYSFVLNSKNEILDNFIETLYSTVEKAFTANYKTYPWAFSKTSFKEFIYFLTQQYIKKQMICELKKIITDKSKYISS